MDMRVGPATLWNLAEKRDVKFWMRHFSETEFDFLSQHVLVSQANFEVRTERRGGRAGSWGTLAAHGGGGMDNFFLPPFFFCLFSSCCCSVVVVVVVGLFV